MQYLALSLGPRTWVEHLKRLLLGLVAVVVAATWGRRCQLPSIPPPLPLCCTFNCRTLTPDA
eukprot:9503702-Pyramimonas_sp.AAC.1